MLNKVIIVFTNSCIVLRGVLIIKKRALLIGNLTYIPPITKVTSAVNDVKAIRYKLNQLDFDGCEYFDCTKTDILEKTKTFIDEAPCDSINIVYFSGHGFQLNGENYIVPVDFSNTRNACSLDEILSLTGGKEASFIFIIDACRDDISKGTSRNYTDMKIYPNVYIAHATQFNETASYQDNGYSFFTRTICDVILTPNITIDELFQQVRNDLYNNYGSQLSSTINGLLLKKKVVLNPIIQTDNLDVKIYNFIEKYGQRYNEEFGYFAGEIELTIDASQKFDISLLDVMYKYQKISSKIYKQELLEESVMKRIMFKYLLSSGLKAENYSWSYKGRMIRLGEIPPPPPSMQKLKPVPGREIDVLINIVVLNDGILVNTNLPNGFILHAKVDDDLAFFSSTVVEGKCFFQLNAEHSNKESKVTITSPTVNVMSEVAKEKVGLKGRNLVGEFVTYDEIWGNTIYFEK